MEKKFEFEGETAADPASAPPPDTSTERVVSKQAITIGEFVEFSYALPNRDVVLKYPSGAARRLTLQEIRDSFVGFSLDQHIYDEELSYVLAAMRSKDGWLCLEFSLSLAVLVKDIFAHESAVRVEESAHQLVRVLRQLESHIEIGVSQSHLMDWLRDSWGPYRDFRDAHATRYPLFTAVVSAAFSRYRQSLEVWREHRDPAPYQFFGGGFGLAGAIEGMGAACVLQAIVDQQNKGHADLTRAKLVSEWFHASLMTEVAHESLSVV